MFIDNKYKKVYFLLIEKAKNRKIPLDGYFERHHIIPRCMGGSNTIENITKMTAREHYIAHLLLTKMTVGTIKKSMCYALVCFNRKNPNHTGRLRPKSRWYEYSKKMVSEVQTGSKNPKIGDALRGRKRPTSVSIAIGNAHRGKIVSKDTRAKQSLAKKGLKASEETKLKMSIARKGIIFTDEHCNNISKSYRKSDIRTSAISESNKTKRKPCTLDGIKIFESKHALEEMYGRGVNGSRSPLFRFI